jgi:hypothetical protein
LRAGAAAVGRRSSAPRQGGVAGVGQTSAPGVNPTWLWVWDGLRAKYSLPGVFAGLGVVRGGACRDGGGLAWRGIAGERGRGT